MRIESRSCLAMIGAFWKEKHVLLLAPHVTARVHSCLNEICHEPIYVVKLHYLGRHGKCTSNTKKEGYFSFHMRSYIFVILKDLQSYDSSKFESFCSNFDSSQLCNPLTFKRFAVCTSLERSITP